MNEALEDIKMEEVAVEDGKDAERGTNDLLDNLDVETRKFAKGKGKGKVIAVEEKNLTPLSVSSVSSD